MDLMLQEILSFKKWINSPLPLPFGKANNKRSIISINNLADFIIHTFSIQVHQMKLFLLVT